MKPLALGVRFLLELYALVGVTYAGLTVQGITGAAVLAAVFAAAWGRWAAPKSERRLEDGKRLAFEALMFGAAAVALWFSLAPIFGIVLVLAVALDTAVLRRLHAW